MTSIINIFDGKFSLSLDFLEKRALTKSDNILITDKMHVIKWPVL